jgi:hypothetical protein
MADMDMKTWRHGDMVMEMTQWKNGDIDMRNGNMEKWRHGDMTWKHRDMETRTWKHGHGDMGMEIRTWRQGILKISNGKRKLRQFSFYHLLIMQTEVCRFSVC